MKNYFIMVKGQPVDFEDNQNNAVKCLSYISKINFIFK